MTYLILYLSTAIIFLAIDFVWLSYIAGPYYKQELGDLMLDDVKIGIAGGFYMLYAVGLVIFAVKPAIDADQYTTALLYGALFGFFCYGTYDMTNLATLKGWPAHITAIDIAWGTTVSGVSAVLGYFASKYILNLF